MLTGVILQPKRKHLSFFILRCLSLERPNDSRAHALLWKKKKSFRGTSPVVQWLRLHASSEGEMGLMIPGQEVKILHAQDMAKKKNKTFF